jgi:hypothetical protein
VNNGISQDIHEGGRHVGANDQRGACRQQGDVGRWQLRLKLYRPPVQYDFGQSRKSIGVGLGL